jgi:NAD(P)-dependent dehydrogenase (short-subunit alcohol dehydrogenase family)
LLEALSHAYVASSPASPLFLLRFKDLSGRREERPLGVKGTAVAPGAFRTDFLSAHSIRKSDREDSVYAPSVGRSSAVIDAMAGKQIGDPDRAALAILAAVRGTTRGRVH